MSKTKIEGKEKLGLLDADTIRESGAEAFTAETEAIKRIVDADTLGGQQREQVELSLIPRMQSAEEFFPNIAKMAALKVGHEARIQALQIENADILKYEKGDAQVKALQENQNKQNEENKRYELDRQKLAADGEAKLTETTAKGVADRIALQKALKKAILMNRWVMPAKRSQRLWCMN